MFVYQVPRYCCCCTCRCSLFPKMRRTWYLVPVHILETWRKKRLLVPRLLLNSYEAASATRSNLTRWAAGGIQHNAIPIMSNCKIRRCPEERGDLRLVYVALLLFLHKTCLARTDEYACRTLNWLFVTGRLVVYVTGTNVLSFGHVKTIRQYVNTVRQ